MSTERELTITTERELTDTELDAVSGGTTPTPKLYEAACLGTHIPEVVIE